MLTILASWKGTTEINTLNLYAEYELVIKNYGTEEIPSKILSNTGNFVEVQTIAIAK